MRRIPQTLAVILALAPAPSWSLSCLPPDPARLYMEARDSAEVYAIVIGKLHSDRPIAVPEVGKGDAFPKDSSALTRARMSGTVLGAEAFDETFDREIDVKVTCLSIWCGKPVVDQDILAAIRLTDNGPELEIGPCGGLTVPISDADTEGLLKCHRTGRCRTR